MSVVATGELEAAGGERTYCKGGACKTCAGADYGAETLGPESGGGSGYLSCECGRGEGM